MSFIIGLSPLEDSCPVCDVSPPMFRELGGHGVEGVENVVECGRCGLPWGIDISRGDGKRTAVPAASVAMIPAFRKFWKTTGVRITFPEFARSPEMSARLDSFNAWADEHPELVAQAKIATSAPYTSITGVRVTVGYPDGRTEPGWNLILPAEGLGVALGFPVPAEPFIDGTIVTIQTPTMTRIERPEPDEPTG